MTKPETLTFPAVSRRVVRRLVVARWFRWLGRTAVGVFPTAAVLVLAAWYFEWPWWIALGTLALVPLWLATTALGAWLARPSPEAALAYWDEVAGRKEMFVSAYCFASQAGRDAGEEVHLRRAARRLEAEAARLARDLPARLAHRAWALPAALVGLVGLLSVGPSPAEVPGVDPAARAQAAEAGRVLARRIRVPDEDEGLAPEEREELERLKDAVRETAEKLRSLDDQTQRGVLDELEKRAHMAEELAESLDPAGDDELSSKMLEELARHADTADLGSTLRAKDFEKGSDEAEKLADRLDREDLSREEARRIEEALKQSLDVATRADKEGLIGKHLDKAHDGLRKKRPKDAADQFQRLAKALDRSRLRRLSRQRLQQLARQLRSAGQQIFGRKPPAIRRLAQLGNRQSGLQPLGAQQLQALGNVPLQHQLGAITQGQLGQATPGARVALGRASPGASGQTPVPATGANPASGQRAAPVPGAPVAPIPGTGACPQCGGACQGACQGSGQGTGQGQGAGSGLGQGAGAGQLAGAVPVPGTTASPSAGDGGHFAGHGSAAYGNTATRPLESTGTGVVDARVSAEGPSRVRQVEQSAHREGTLRESQQLAVDFIRTEEEALAEEPLPLSRREQVLRYFTALRRRLVEHEPTGQPDP